MSRMGELTRARDEARRIEATALARAALASLRDANIDAWVIGSLARGEFRQHSDIDVLIDAPPDRKSEALVTCLRALREFPSSIVFKSDVPPHILPYMIAEACDESGLCG